MDKLSSRNILITGASRGLGLEIAKEMWSCGANLILSARSESELVGIRNNFLKECKEGRTVDCITADLGDNDSAGAILKFAQKKWKKIDVLVNNAGMTGPIGKVWENDWDDWHQTIQVNLLATVNLVRVIIPWMAENGGGKIINLSGGGGTGPRPNFTAYAVSKVGIVRFTEIVAEETSKLNIQINCIAPGALKTDMMQAVVDAGPKKAGKREHDHALKILKDGLDNSIQAVKLCSYLASDASGNITGKLISAVWDPWERLSEHEDELLNSDIFTLRRIIPEDRGEKWS